MTDLKSTDFSQKLMRCQVSGKDGGDSDRFVELEYFRMWSYMMTHKHGLVIGEPTLWLWLKEEDYAARKNLYDKAPEVLRVNRLGIFLFDEIHGFSHVIHRYTPDEEGEVLEKILASHVAPELIEAGSFELSVIQGYCVRTEIRNPERLVLGVDFGDTRAWYREK